MSKSIRVEKITVLEDYKTIFQVVKIKSSLWSRVKYLLFNNRVEFHIDYKLLSD